MATRVLRRRESAAFLSGFVGGLAELLVDTTKWRVQVHDGATPGGHPMARYDDIFGRAEVDDADYSVLASDNFVGFVNLSATRTITLPLANTVPPGKKIIIADETGSCSDLLPIVVASQGINTISGEASISLESAYAMGVFVSNGLDMWFVDGTTVAVFP